MASQNKQLVSSQRAAAANTPQLFYTSPSNGAGTVISNFTATNDLADSTRTYKAYIVLSGGAVDTPIVNTRAVTRFPDVSAEMAGQFIPANAGLYMESDVAESIIWTVSGRVLT